MEGFEEIRKKAREKVRAKVKDRTSSRWGEKMKSQRTRRRAREMFTELKATGRIPKTATFEELSDKKFFQAADDIREDEMKREIINAFDESRDSRDNMRQKSGSAISKEERKKMLKEMMKRKRKP